MTEPSSGRWADADAAEAGRGHLTLWEAARALVIRGGANEQTIWKVQIDAAYETLARAAEEGRLRVRHPETLLLQDCSEWAPPSSGCLVCTLEDLNAWLAAEGVPYRFPMTSPAPTPRPLQRQQAQQAAILAKLAELGFDAQAVPAAPAGKPSPAKQQVRAALGYSPDVMNKAWQRLRTAGSIKDA